MTSTSIPDEAIGAAEWVLTEHQRRDNRSCLCGWDDLGKSHPRHQAQIVLEAVAPHLTSTRPGIGG